MPFNDTNIYHVSMILTSNLPRSNNQAWNKCKMFDGFHTLMKDHLKVPESRRTGKNVKCNVAQIFCNAKKLYNISIMQKHKTVKAGLEELYSESVVFRIRNKVRLIHHS
jgi:hypothetical protein